MKEFDLEEIRLNTTEQSDLLSVSAHPGFQVIMKIMKSTCDGFISDLMNVPVGSDDVVAKHSVAQTAARLYTRFVGKINNEIGEYKQLPKDNKPIDVTEGILDLGDYDLEETWNQ